jgi:hypothetical protein
VYSPNHPVYQNGYSFASLGGGSWRVTFLAKQTQTNTVFFKMPLEIKVSFSTGADTTIRVLNDVNNQLFTFTFNRQPTALQFDPNNNVVLKQASLVVLDAQHAEGVPSEFSLQQNFPNPFNPLTTIRYGLPEQSRVRLVVSDILGRVVSELVNENLPAGQYSVQLDAATLSSGVYFYTLNAGAFSSTKSLLVLK